MAASISLGLSQLSLEASRRHATVIMALDKSGSMITKHQSKGLFRKSKSRMDTAIEGACRVVDALSDDDHVAVLAFGSDVENVCDGAVQLNALTKLAVKQRIQAIRPSGRTSLYDTILAGCMIVLSIAAEAAQAGRQSSQDMGTFWLVVVTDGEDTSSNHSLSDVREVLIKINQQLGSQAMQLALIGVALDAGARRCLQQLDAAGGDMTKFVDAKNLEEVTQAFDDIAVRLVQRTVQIPLGTASTSSPQAQQQATTQALLTGGWDGPIQTGSHVRVVGESRGSVPGVDFGDVGVVQGRDTDGDYVVNFPRRDKWFGRPDDIVLDEEAERVRPGALVKVKDSVETPLYNWGSYSRGQFGMVREVANDGDVVIQYSGGETWKGILQEFTVVDDGLFQGSFPGTWPGRLQLGQAVRVKIGLDSPSTGWGNLKRGEVGYVKEYQAANSLYVCDFPSVDGWKGRAQDLEVERVATLIRPGVKVRVRQGVTPVGGWAGVSHASVGTVVSSRYDGGCVVVKFPEHPTWKGKLSELETLDRPATVQSTSPSAPPTMYEKPRVKEPSPLGELIPLATPVSSSIPEVPVAPAKLDSEVDVDAFEVSGFAIKSMVVINGLTSQAGSQFNGKQAEVRAILPDDRYMVQIVGDYGQPKTIKGCYLAKHVSRHPNQSLVYITGVKADPALNGEVGVISGFDEGKGRYLVKVDGRTISLAPANVDVIADVEELC